MVGPCSTVVDVSAAMCGESERVSAKSKITASCVDGYFELQYLDSNIDIYCT